jgi:hypothetical protein
MIVEAGLRNRSPSILIEAGLQRKPLTCSNTKRDKIANTKKGNYEGNE